MLRLDFEVRHANFSLCVTTDIGLDSSTAVIGANGCGKTTLLRSIVGLERVQGTIEHLNETWVDTSKNIYKSPRVRSVGYLSQNPSLFPHLTVEGNLMLARRLSRSRKLKSAAPSMEELISQFDLQHLRKRRLPKISGGERARVALAQVLLSRPAILLLDEPLASIDINRKQDFLPYLEAYLQVQQIPMLYVTHDLSEIARVCQSTIALDNGRIIASGTSANVLQEIQQDKVVGHNETSVLVHVQLDHYDREYQLAHFRLKSQQIAVPTTEVNNLPNSVYLRLRDRDVTISLSQPTDISIRNVLEGVVQSISVTKASPFASITIECDEQTIVARITRLANHQLNLRPGLQVYVLIKSVTVER